MFTTLSQAAFNHQIPRKTLEYYVKGKATLESYQKMGLPHPDELLASREGETSFPALTESSGEGAEASVTALAAE